MAIQQAINQALATAAVGAGGYKHFNDKKVEETAAIKSKLVEAGLKSSEEYAAGKIVDSDIEKYQAATQLGLRASPDYKPMEDYMKSIVARQTLSDKLLAKKLQSDSWRARMMNVKTSQLTEAMKPMSELEEARIEALKKEGKE